MAAPIRTAKIKGLAQLRADGLGQLADDIEKHGFRGLVILESDRTAALCYVDSYQYPRFMAGSRALLERWRLEQARANVLPRIAL